MAKGDLCYKKGGNSLCFKSGGSALVYKADPVAKPTEATVRVPWAPQSYTCTTYNTYHEITFSCSGSFTRGSGSVVSKTDGGTETIFKLQVTKGPAVFTVSVSDTTPCSATEEDPGATCRVLAAQTGATPKSKSGVTIPRIDGGASPNTVRVSFDSNKKLTGVN